MLSVWLSIWKLFIVRSSNYQCKCFTNYIGQYCEECAGADRYSYQCENVLTVEAGSTCDSGIYGNGECKCNRIKIKKSNRLRCMP